MSTTVIILIILGLSFIFVSYAFASRLEDEKDADDGIIKIPDELTDEDKEKIKKLIDDYMDQNIDSKLDEIEDKLSAIVNEKTLALGDYAVSVNEEIERNHSEVLFLYSMLSDKQKEIMTTATMVDDYRKDIEAFVQNNDISIKPAEEQQLEDAIREIDENIEQEVSDEELELEQVDSNKDVILEMHKSGLSILEIAKQLGLGVGEVKLIVDLYQGAKE